MSLLQEIKEMLSTWRATAVLLLLLAAAMAAATFLEAELGTEAARGVVYHAWWFFVLYGLLIANFVLVSHRYGLWRRKQWGLLLLHYGFAVILGGAAITHLWGYEGMMHIRTGQSSDRLFAADAHRKILRAGAALAPLVHLLLDDAVFKRMKRDDGKPADGL